MPMGVYDRSRRQSPEEKRILKIERRERDKASGYFKWWHLRRAFGLTKEAFESLWNKQKGICPICHKVLVSDFVVDHDRSCCSGMKSCGKCIRGILHRKCNCALGMLDDSPDALRNAAVYLERELL